MKILALDTATAVAGVAAYDTEKGATHALRERVTTHSEKLLVLIDGCLGGVGWAPRELEGVVCGAGPGSFTGLRIGVATAKGLCFALGIPLVMVSSLESLAMRHEGQGESAVLSCLDAWRGLVYARLFFAEKLPGWIQLSEEHRQRLEKETTWQPQELVEALSARSEGLIVCGDGPQRYHELAMRGVTLDEDPYPHPLDVARLGARRLLAGDVDSLAGAAPNYISPSAAELSIKQGG